MNYCPVDGTGGDVAHVEDAVEREASAVRRREADIAEAFQRMEAERLAEAEANKPVDDPRQMSLFGGA